jgi:hypothetical protein
MIAQTERGIGSDFNVGNALETQGRTPCLATTTQRYMHLSPAATEDAIRLLDERQTGLDRAEKFGDILDTRKECVDETVENRR